MKCFLDLFIGNSDNIFFEVWIYEFSICLVLMKVFGCVYVICEIWVFYKYYVVGEGLKIEIEDIW